MFFSGKRAKGVYIPAASLFGLCGKVTTVSRIYFSFGLLCRSWELLAVFASIAATFLAWQRFVFERWHLFSVRKYTKKLVKSDFPTVSLCLSFPDLSRSFSDSHFCVCVPMLTGISLWKWKPVGPPGSQWVACTRNDIFMAIVLLWPDVFGVLVLWDLNLSSRW